MNTTHLIATLAVSAFTLPFGGCIIDGSIGDDPGLFPCTSDADCIAARQVCNQVTNTCGFERPEPGCDDEDYDGYGCGDERTACAYAERDTCCDCPDVYPGATDLCDGKDNDSDGATDEPLDCERISDCPTQNLPEAAFFRCENNLCTLRPADTTSPGCDIVLNCTGAAYDQVPEACK